jgi:aspartate/methionine/tyrosine aminotransferase
MAREDMLAASLSRLGTETAFEVLARARQLEQQGSRVIHLEIGEPDFPTPGHIVEAGARALVEGHTHYCPAPGIPVLREACAEHLARHRGLPIEADRVLVAPGAKPFLLFSVLATCDPGDEVIYPNPGFPIYESVIRFAGAVPVPLPLVEEAGFAFSADDLADRLTPRTRLVILNSPANPTGGVITRELNRELARVLADHRAGPRARASRGPSRRHGGTRRRPRAEACTRHRAARRARGRRSPGAAGTPRASRRPRRAAR